MERPRVKLIKRLRDDALPPVVSDYFFNQDEKVDFLSENPIGKFWECMETIIAAMRSTRRLEVQSEERHAPEKRSIVGSVDAFMSEK